MKSMMARSTENNLPSLASIDNHFAEVFPLCNVLLQVSQYTVVQGSSAYLVCIFLGIHKH